MLKEITVQRTKDWSLNLEDPYYVEHREEMITESLEAIQHTSQDCYVNLVTPEGGGHPEEWFIPTLLQRLLQYNIKVERLQYIDECGCGGYVTRAYR